MKLDLRLVHTGAFLFLSRHYHGLTVALDRGEAEASLSRAFRDFPVSVEGLIGRWALGPEPRVLHGAAELEPVFAAFYRVPDAIRIPYFQVKILELLLCLNALPIPEKGAGPPYFLPLPGGDRQGHSGLSHPASVRKLHPGGAFPQVPHPPDPHEALLPGRLWHGHRRLAHQIPHGSGGGNAPHPPGSQHRGHWLRCGLWQPGEVYRGF